MAAEKLGLEVIVEGFKKFMKNMESMDDSITTTGKRWNMLSGSAKKAGKVLGNIAKVGITAVAVGATAAAAAVGGLAVGIGKLAIEAVPVEGIGDAFRGMAADVEGGAGAMLLALQEASKGTVANRDLMMSFNQAYQLVGETFAKEDLPAAMGYLGKVSAATGQDMDFMMDSLVKGIGRLSPMILDNLGIQVNLTEATEAYAKELGVQASELDKAQQQTALMNQVLEKLAVNTADMPDVTDSAATAMAQWRANVQNFKDTIGLAFLPILKKVMAVITQLGKKVFPIVAEFISEKLAPAVEKAIEFLTNLFAAIKSGIAGFQDEGLYIGIENFLDKLGIAPPPELWNYLDRIVEIIGMLGDWIQGTAIPAIEDFWQSLQVFAAWVKENAVPILAGLAAMLLAIVIPAFIAWATSAVSAAVATVTALAPVILPILAIGAAVALLVKAWKSNWGGIQEKTKAVVSALQEYWENVLLPAMQQIWTFIKEKLWPIFVRIAEIAVEIVGKAIRDLTRIWETVLYPAIVMIWTFINNSVIPLLQSLAEVLVAVVGKAIEILTALWENVLYPAIQKIWSFIKENVLPIFQALGSEVKDRLGPVLEWLARVVLPVLQRGLEVIGAIVQSVAAWFHGLAEVISNIQVPEWMQGDSPPPLAQWLGEISDEVQRLAALELPRLTANFTVAGQAATASVGAMSGSNVYNEYNYNLTTQSLMQPGTLQMEFADMTMATR